MTLVDNNILSSLAKIDRLHLLNSLFDEVATTPSVLDELHSDAVAGYDFVARIDEVKHYNGGWLHIRSPTETEIERTENIVDASLSFTDAECIAVAQRRDERFLTDDSHAGEIASQEGVDVWDLALFIEACITADLLSEPTELDAVIEDLQLNDCYRFSQADRNRLYNQL